MGTGLLRMLLAVYTQASDARNGPGGCEARNISPLSFITLLLGEGSLKDGTGWHRLWSASTLGFYFHRHMAHGRGEKSRMAHSTIET